MFPFGFSNAERLLVIPPWQFLYSYSRILDKCLSSVGIHRLGGGGGEGRALCEPRPEYEYSFLDCRQGIEERISLGLQYALWDYKCI